MSKYGMKNPGMGKWEEDTFKHSISDAELRHKERKGEAYIPEEQLPGNGPTEDDLLEKIDSERVPAENPDVEYEASPEEIEAARAALRESAGDAARAHEGRRLVSEPLADAMLDRVIRKNGVNRTDLRTQLQNGDAVLLLTGAKLAKHNGNYVIYGYSPDGADVQREIKEARDLLGLEESSPMDGDEGSEAGAAQAHGGEMNPYEDFDDGEPQPVTGMRKAARTEDSWGEGASHKHSEVDFHKTKKKHEDRKFKKEAEEKGYRL